MEILKLTVDPLIHTVGGRNPIPNHRLDGAKTRCIGPFFQQYRQFFSTFFGWGGHHMSSNHKAPTNGIYLHSPPQKKTKMEP